MFCNQNNFEHHVNVMSSAHDILQDVFTTEHSFSTQGLSAFQPWHVDPTESAFRSIYIMQTLSSPQTLSHDVVVSSVYKF